MACAGRLQRWGQQKAICWNIMKPIWIISMIWTCRKSRLAIFSIRPTRSHSAQLMVMPSFRQKREHLAEMLCTHRFFSVLLAFRKKPICLIRDVRAFIRNISENKLPIEWLAQKRCSACRQTANGKRLKNAWCRTAAFMLLFIAVVQIIMTTERHMHIIRAIPVITVRTMRFYWWAGTITMQRKTLTRKNSRKITVHGW